MVSLQARPTAALSPALLRDLRALLDAAFDGDFSDDDWVHALGGVHVWASDARGVLSHGSLVVRTLLCSGQSLPVGYVEAVATAPAYRRQGHGTRVMKHLGGLIHEGFRLGVLSTGSPDFYKSLGWERWRGLTAVTSPSGHERTPDDDGGVMILRTPTSPLLDLDGEIVCDWRVGDVW